MAQHLQYLTVRASLKSQDQSSGRYFLAARFFSLSMAAPCRGQEMNFAVTTTIVQPQDHLIPS